MKSGYLPTGAAPKGELRSLRFAPSPALASRVVSFFCVELDEGQRGSVTTFPEGCADIFIDLGDAPRGWVAGPQTRSQTFSYTQRTRQLGAQLFPGVLGLLTDRPSRDFVDQSHPLEELLPGAEVPRWIASLQQATTHEARIALFDAFLRRHLNTSPVDPRISHAVDTILQRGGQVGISQLADDAHTSPRHLGRLFHRWLGISPKILCRIVRFQHVLEQMNPETSTDWAGLAAELGYADQAHLIREFAQFAGVTPTGYRRLQTDATAG